MVAGDQQLVHTPFVPPGYWSPCAPLRYLKRIRDRRQNSQLKSSTCSVIVQSTTGSILERLKSDISLTIEQSGVHDEQPINVDNHTNNIIDNESKHKL
ncbi:unnamed protein product [Schistosoma mattheei]|uniref:Uncharacterized protein n=1 Tax=Schistosoma mattheei TaxID=31246 RepID=A0A183Q722_9TREM|nr:unnamed protein product [Schistosoma mattheei]